MLHSQSTASNLRSDHLAPGSMISHGMVRAIGSLSEERAKTSEQAPEMRLTTGSVQLSSWTLVLLVERLLDMPRYELCESDADVDHYRSVGPTSTTIPSCVRIRRQLGRASHRCALQVR